MPDRLMTHDRQVPPNVYQISELVEISYRARTSWGNMPSSVDAANQFANVAVDMVRDVPIDR